MSKRWQPSDLLKLKKKNKAAVQEDLPFAELANRTPQNDGKGYWKFLGPEDTLHYDVCKYIKRKDQHAVIHHSPNAGKRTRFEIWKLKILFVSPGFPDLLVLIKAKQKIFAIELKTEKSNEKKGTVLQRAWIEVLNLCGIPAKVCVGYEEATQFIDEQMN